MSPSTATDRPRLLTFAISHYCEKARWALDHAGVDYVEQPHLPLLHTVYTRHAGGGSVPLLITASAALTDSAAILRWADARSTRASLLPTNAGQRQQALEMERRLDRELGPHARRWAYGALLGHMGLLRPCFVTGIPAWERALAPALLALLPTLIRRGYRVTPDTAQRSLERAREVFRWVEDMLTDGRPYLVGTGFGAADLTFAALAAPLLLPDQYGGRLPALAALPESTRATVLGLRATRAGRHALDVYARHRRQPPVR